jgi:DNA-binding XRE family transcriptional regulator
MKRKPIGKVKLLRALAGLTQGQLAEIVGVTHQYISSVEKLDQKPEKVITALEKILEGDDE